MRIEAKMLRRNKTLSEMPISHNLEKQCCGKIRNRRCETVQRSAEYLNTISYVSVYFVFAEIYCTYVKRFVTEVTYKPLQ